MIKIKELCSKATIKLIKNKSLTKINICLGLLYALRLILCILPQHGYLHPDEFFQFTEPMAVKTGFKGTLTWEWRDKPIRSVVLPYLLGGSLMKLLKFLHGNKIMCSYLVLVLPRLLFTLVSFSLDYLLFKCCTIGKIAKVKEILIVFATSYLTLVHLGHTLTNTIECWLFGLLLYIVFKCIKTRKENNIKQLAFVLTLGIWNRPTFILFSLYPIYYWSNMESHQSRKPLANIKILAVRVLKLLSFVKLFSMVFILIDTLFYEGDYVSLLISSKSLSNLDLKRLIITPMNFIQFNLKPANLKIFGINPLYMHLVLNLQLLFCFLGIFLIQDVFILCRNSFNKKQRIVHFKTNFRTVLALSTLPPLVVLSLVPHQEPRFLLPLLFPLVLLYASKCYNNKTLLSIWIIFNLVLTVFYGFVHQAGVTKSMFLIKPELSKTNAQNLNIIYSSTYLPPEHLFGLTSENLPKYSAKINFYDLSNAKFPEDLLRTLNIIKNSSKSSRHQTYLVAPSTLDRDIIRSIKKLSLDSVLFKQIFPTFDFENFKLPTTLFSLSELKSKFSTNIWLIN